MQAGIIFLRRIFCVGGPWEGVVTAQAHRPSLQFLIYKVSWDAKILGAKPLIMHRQCDGPLSTASWLQAVILLYVVEH